MERLKQQDSPRELKLEQYDALSILFLSLISLILIVAILQLSWNCSMPHLFNGVSHMTMMQSLCLLIVIKILFGNMCGNMTRNVVS
jgi:hypothetical protein